jgi:hypothetical protein
MVVASAIKQSKNVPDDEAVKYWIAWQNYILSQERAAEPSGILHTVRCETLTAYHGSDADNIDVFWPSEKMTKGLGTYFALEKAAAVEFALHGSDGIISVTRKPTVYAVEINDLNLADMRRVHLGENSDALKGGFVNFLRDGIKGMKDKDPVDYATQIGWAETAAERITKDGVDQNRGVSVINLVGEFFTEYLYRNGYDGVICDYEHDSKVRVPYTEVIIFDPRKITITESVDAARMIDVHPEVIGMLRG